jgi:signal peptidase II
VPLGKYRRCFRLFQDSNSFFIILSAVTLAGLLFFAARGAFADTLSQWGVALLIPGILGNVTDRFIHGHVVDFLLFDLHVRFANPWPAFNVADSCICIAAGMFIISSFREAKNSAKQ